MSYWLSQGSHRRREDGMCAMERVSFLAGEDHSAEPVCVSEVLTNFCIGLNDGLPDDQRQRLSPYLARTIGTRGDGLDDVRRWLCVDWLVREYAPTFLELTPSLRANAETLRALPSVGVANVEGTLMDLSTARWQAGAVKWAAFRGGWTTLRVVQDATWETGKAVRATARAASGTTTKAAWEAGCNAAGAAAWTAAGNVAGAIPDEFFAPSVLSLRDSILRPGGLLDRMLPTVPLVFPWLVGEPERSHGSKVCMV